MSLNTAKLRCLFNNQVPFFSHALKSIFKKMIPIIPNLKDNQTFGIFIQKKIHKTVLYPVQEMKPLFPFTDKPFEFNKNVQDGGTAIKPKPPCYKTRYIRP